MRSATKHALWAWLPLALWLAVLALESTDTFSSTHTGNFLYPIATALFGHIDVHRFEVVHALLRKIGHLAGYAILSLLFFRALRQSFTSAAGSAYADRRWALLAIVLTMLAAALDEFHQSFLPSRTGTLRDVALDTFGAVCMQAAVLVILRLRTARSFQQTSQAAD